MAKILKMRCRLPVLMAEQDPPLTQRRLAKEVGISTTTVNQLYNNKFQKLDVETVEKLCKYFRCEVGDLFVMKEVEDKEAHEEDLL